MMPACEFAPGRIVSTQGALATFSSDQLPRCLRRHLGGDWGDLCDEDKDANEQALTHGGRLFSSYELPEGKLWIITEADRSVTTFLLPEEY